MADLVIRPSSLSTFSDCPRRWAARHLRDEVSAAGYTLRTGLGAHVGGAVGTGVHGAAGFTLAEKIKTGGASSGSDADAEEVGIQAFRERVQTDGCDWDTVTPTANTAERQIRRMSKVWRRSEAAQGMPRQVEERLEATVAPGIVASGQVDGLMTGDLGDVIRDTKTGRRRANGVQYGTYALIWRAHDYRPAALIEDHLPRVSIEKEQPPPTAHRIDLHAAQMEAWETIEAVGRAVAEFRERAADPNGRAPHMAFRSNPASSLCAARWCPAWGSDFCKSHI